MRSIKTSVVGTAALTREDIAPALLALKGRLMERNVAENIAERCVAASICASSLSLHHPAGTALFLILSLQKLLGRSGKSHSHQVQA